VQEVVQTMAAQNIKALKVSMSTMMSVLKFDNRTLHLQRFFTFDARKKARLV
jgi:hypothetical protein